LQQYANLPDPPQTDEQRALEARIRTRIGPVLDQYLATRSRNLDVDLFALQLLAENGFDRFVLGQDDAGPVGLHLHDLASLRTFVERWGLEKRASIEPGADELAMALTSAAIARQAAFVPSINVIYSRADGGSINDPLEFAPIDTTINQLIATSGAQRKQSTGADINLYVRIAGTNDADETVFVDAIERDIRAGRPAAVADLTFLAANNLPEQRALVEELLRRKIAGDLAAFASWNTTANTIGTTVPEAIAVVAGKRTGAYSDLAHAQFMLDRYADDYAFHAFTRPELNTTLSGDGITDHTYLLPGPATATSSQNRSDLWLRTLDLLRSIYPQYRDAGLTITLPWDRTFETKIDVRLAR
jgi:hypothetical protein